MAMRTAKRTAAASAPDGERAPALDPAMLEEWALAYLGRYASSAGNLRRVLLRRIYRRTGATARVDGETAAAIEALIERYRTAGLIDDAAYAAARARQGLARGRSLRQIGAGLAAKGIGSEETASALQSLRKSTGDPDLAAACAFARRRRLGPYRRADGDPVERKRALAVFARAGFSRQTAELVLKCRDEAAVAALLEAS